MHAAAAHCSSKNKTCARPDASRWCAGSELWVPAHVQVQTALGAVLRDEAAREQPCGVFGSFGWSGEAVDEMEGRLKVLHGSSQS
jgi:hypothetical protein